MKRLTTALVLIFGSFGIAACSGNGPEEEQTNQSESQFPSFCDVEEWECVQFEDGPNLTGNRHGHQAFVLDYERVLLIGGFIRDADGLDRRVDTCEMVNPITNETRVVTNGINQDCFIRTRRDATVVQLNDKSLLAIGGADAQGTRSFRTERFNLETEEWEWAADMPQPATNYQRYRSLNAMVLEDGRVFILRVNGQFGQFNPDIPGGYLYDPEEDTWTQLDMPELEVSNVTGMLLPGTNEVLMILSEVDAMSKVPLIVEDPELGELQYHQGYPLRIYRYDIDSQEWDRVGTLDERGVGLTPSIHWLPERTWMLINVYGDDLRPTYGYLFDPGSNFRQKQFERDPIPGRALTVLPGDRLLYQSNDFAQYYDIETDRWFMFDAFAPGTFYTTLTQLQDCRIFGSGERALPPEGEGEDMITFERRGIDTGYCTPVAAE